MKLHQELLHADLRSESFEAAEDEAIKRALRISLGLRAVSSGIPEAVFPDRVAGIP